MRQAIAIRSLLAALIISCSFGTARAQTVPNPSGLTEADIAPCNDLLAVRIARYKDRSELSNLTFALSIPPFAPLYNLGDTREFLKSWKEVIEILEAHDEERMAKVIGIVFRGQEYADRLTNDRRFYCLLNVRLAQLTGSKPKPPAPSKVQSPTVNTPAAPPSAPSSLQTKLDTYGPGQLFALADELAEQGKTSEARAARRALVSRFPDSPLSATAAQQLAASPTSVPR